MAERDCEPEGPEKERHGENAIAPGIERPLSFPNPHRVFVERAEIEDGPEVFRGRAARASQIAKQVEVENEQ